MEQLVRQVLESVRRTGRPEPNRMFKVGYFGVSRAGWAISTEERETPETTRGLARSYIAVNYWLLSNGRIATNVWGDKVRRSLPPSDFGNSRYYSEMMTRLRGLIVG